MNHMRNTVAAVVASAALTLVAACGDLEPPANDIGKTVEKKSTSPKIPVKTNLHRMDFGDGEATLPVKPRRKGQNGGNASRLDFGDNGRA